MHWQVPVAVSSPPRQFSALVLTQLPPASLPPAAVRWSPAGQPQAPLVIVPPSQTMALSSALRVGWISARQAPLATSRWVLSGQAHCAERFRVSVVQGSEAIGAGTGAVGGGAACEGFETQ